MLIRVGVMVLRICALLALILGIIVWIANINIIVPIHMLLGILVMLSLWALAFGIATAPKGRNIGLAIGAFVLSLVMLFVGLQQTNSLFLTPSTHWIIQVVHLLIGIGAIGIGEAIAGRYRRLNKA